ncbi:Ig-like domain-containing protein [Reichenbachiella sp.]|uniref:Ig-like domain-containing protein n=1 Tax=Reichenbachiella sp. TaxID=2184521 RepID=UPI003BB133F4
MKQLKRLLTSTFLASALLFACTEDEPEVDITDIKFDGDKVIVTEGFTVDLDTTLVITGSDADQAQISFSSGDETIFSVDGFILTAVKAGTTTVTATEANTELTASIPVEVVAKTVDVTGVSLDKETADMKVGDELQLTATVAPEDATEKGITWSVVFSSDAKSKEDSPTDIATVSDEGLVKALAAGDVVVTAKTKDGEFTASVSITITNIAVTQITISPESVSVNVNETAQLTATVIPDNATLKEVSWSVDFDAEAGRMQVAAPSVDTYLEISDDGLLKAKERCDECAFIARATSSDGEVSSYINVTINYIPVTSITLDPNELFNIFKGDTRQIEYTVLPEDATDPTVSSWDISHTGVPDLCGLSSIDFDNYATVDENGVLTASSSFFDDCNNNLIVRAHHPDLANAATVEFDVTNPVESLDILDDTGESATSIDWHGCGSYDLGVSITATSPYNSSVTWSSESPDILPIDKNGVISLGPNPPVPLNTTIKVTVTADDGSGAGDTIDIVINYNEC